MVIRFSSLIAEATDSQGGLATMCPPISIHSLNLKHKQQLMNIWIPFLQYDKNQQTLNVDDQEDNQRYEGHHGYNMDVLL